MKNKYYFYIFVILTLFLITTSSVSADELTTTEDLTISDELAIDNEDIINEENNIDAANNLFSSENENSISNGNELLAEDDDSEILSKNITPSGNTFTDIQNAINSANDGDNIILDGTYTQDTTTGEYSVKIGVLINVTKSVNIIGVNNATLKGIILDGVRSQIGLMQILSNGVALKNITFCDGRSIGLGIYPGAMICDGYSFTMDNCKFLNNCLYSNAPGNNDECPGALKLKNSNCNISNCYFYGNQGVNYGGALLIYGNSNVKLYDTTFESNYAPSNGGAVCIMDNAISEFANCTFINNSAINGGAIWFSNISSVKISDSSFEFNNAYDGGAIYTNSCESISVENCSFTNNYAKNNGGTLNINLGTYSILNSNFMNNSAINMSGGALWTDAIGFIKNCSFVKNTAINMSGGALWINEGGSIDNCSFANNSATWGGAARVNNCSVLNCNFADNSATGGGAVTSTSHLTVENCNFTNNHVKNNGGAMDVSSGFNYVLNCNFVNNSANYNGGAIRFSHEGEIINSFFTYNSAKDVGGAVFFNNKGSVNGSSFINNNAKNYGGAIQFASGSASNCAFINCSASNQAGGAIRILKGTITNCSFINCSSIVAGSIYADNNTNILESSFVNSSSSHIAGAIRIGKGSIKGCNFENCSSSNMAGALWVADTGSIEDSAFVGCNATVAGGALYINDVSNFYKISNCIFNNNAIINESQGENRSGGAIFCYALNCDIINSHFNNNTSPDSGGAICVSENTSEINITNCKFNNNSVFNDFDGINRGGGAICSLSNGLNVYNSNFISNNAEVSFGGAIRLINTDNGVFNPTIKRSSFINNGALDGKSVYTDSGSELVLNSFKYNAGDDINKIVYGLSMENLTNSYNIFTESKLNSSIFPTNKTFVFGESIIIPISSENVNNITVTISDGNYQVVFTKDDVVANGEFIVPSLTAGTYTINYVANVDLDMFNPSYAASKLIINKAKSTVSASAVTSYYGKTFSVNVNSNNATSIKYSIKNSKGTVVKSGTINAGASITGLKFAPGTYTVTLNAVVDGNHTSSSATSKITVNKATATITANALTTYYNSGKTWSITLKDTTNNKLLTSQKLTLKVYTGSKYKTYAATTNAKGVATFKASTLTPGSHKVIISYSNSNYNTKAVTTTLKINKMALSYKIEKSTQMDGAGLHIWVKNKATNKVLNKIKIKLLVYTGKKYKTINLVSAKYSNKGNGYAGYAVKGPVYSVGTHTVKIMAGDSYHSGTLQSTLVLKSTVKKYGKKIISISNGKRTVKKG